MRQVARSAASTVLIPFRRLPESKMKNQIRASIWRHAGGPRRHFSLSAPRRELLTSPGDVVVLIGAVNPSLIHRYEDLVGRNGRVLVFEPVSEARERLASAAHQYDNIELDPHGVWPKEGEVTLSSDPDYPGGGRVRHQSVNEELPPLNDPDDVQINVKELDTLLEEHSIEPDFIETMVNGTEYDVLKSGKNTLRNHSPRILCKAFGYGQETPKRVERLISFLGSEQYQVEHAPLRTSQPEPYHPDGDIFAWKN